MRKNLLALGVVAVAILLATTATAANRGVSFTGVGFHPADVGQPYTPASSAYNMSPDGQVIMVSPSPYGNYCFKWTMDDGWGEEVGETGGLCHIDNDGNIGGSGPDYANGYYYPGYWAGEPNVWNLIPAGVYDDCGGSPLSVHGASDNLDYLVGLAWEGCKGRRFFYSRPDNETQVLPCMTDESCRINDVTNDGDKTVGWNTSQCGSWRGADTVDGNYDWIDGLGKIQAKVCTEGGDCCGDNDCPEYVQDGQCDNAGTCDLTGIDCVAGTCTGGPNAGMTCSGYWNCPGECSAAANNPGTACTGDWSCEGTCTGGPNAGLTCTGWCPSTPHCVDNPEYDPMILTDWKGEGYRTTPDGAYTLGYNYGQSPYDWSHPDYDPELWASAYIENSDGSFTQIGIPPGASPYDSWTPLFMSDDGNVVVGRYGWWIYSFPTLWTPGTGTVDFQYFLIAQGLDELWFWTLASLNATSADGTILAGYGTNALNPDCNSAWGCQEGYVVDISKVKVCHKPGDHNERTLTIGLDSAGDHLGHGDFLGTCEFLNSGGNSRWAEQRANRPTQDSAAADSNPMTIRPDEVQVRPTFSTGEESQTDRTRTRKTRAQLRSR